MTDHTKSLEKDKCIFLFCIRLQYIMCMSNLTTSRVFQEDKEYYILVYKQKFNSLVSWIIMQDGIKMQVGKNLKNW